MASILETASRVDVQAEHALAQSDWRTGIQHTRVVDPRQRRRMTLHFAPATFGQIAELRQHYRQSFRLPFAFQIPNGGPTVQARYVEAPRIQIHSRQAREATVVLEECLATDA